MLEKVILTDKERYIAFLESVGFKENKEANGNQHKLKDKQYNIYNFKDTDLRVLLGCGEDTGYAGFCSEMIFDKDGKFKTYGAWE